MADKTKNTCVRLTVGGEDCKNQIQKRKCRALVSDEKCSGRTNGVGANEAEAKKLIAVQKLEDYRSTGEGLGHLSNKRAVHSSPVPFH